MRMLAAETAMALERSDLLARLEEVARTDELTGLLNRRAWEEQLPREMARARRNQASRSASRCSTSTSSRTTTTSAGTRPATGC